MIARRPFVKGGLAATAAFIVPPSGTNALAQTYAVTTETLQRSRSSEADAYRQYVAFARQAKVDGYPGIAYLFTALASAELVHGQNFEKILIRLGVDVTPPPQHQIQLANTRHNLIKAAADELNSVYAFYPDILNRLKPEEFQDAITMTTYAWESEKEHLDILKDIQRWTPNHFEEVAKKIENATGQYFVCQICGAMALHIPRGQCPICRFAPDNYRKVEPPT